ncbi:hypothetical protein [Sorangium sp. So ce362]|uniref:hypothetical protein n=1 Tax=Sorangium sp. So ce362 TaxID=3133303 RepID=UPI003F622D9D
MLTGKTAAGGAYAETDAGAWIPASALRVARLSRDFWGHAKRGRRWIVAVGSTRVIAPAARASPSRRAHRARPCDHRRAKNHQ